MLRERIITAIFIAVGLLASVFWMTPFQLSILFGVILGYAAWEWSDLSGLKSMAGRLSYTGGMALLIVLLGRYAGLPSGVDASVVKSVAFSAILWWLIAFALVRSYPSSTSLWQSSLVRSLMGILVLLPPWLAVCAIVYRGHGREILLIAVAAVVLADVGAYFFGKAFGKNKLAPQVSPGKTWEGVLGGVLSNLVFVGVLLAVLDLKAEYTVALVVLIMFPALLSVIGDLLESMLKRHRGIKDSGNILPGHGGVLDRIDGFTVGLPAFVFVLELSGIQF